MKGSILRRLVERIAQEMHQIDPNAGFSIKLQDHEEIRYGEDRRVALLIRTDRAARRIIRDGFLGFGEAYVNREVEVEGDLQELLRLGFLIDVHSIRISPWQRFLFLVAAFKNDGRMRRSPNNVSYHYDLGNEFYAQYLDETMTYSCGYFQRPENSLKQAQLNKYEHICRKLQLRPGETLIDIGCGWGGMLIYAARNYGITGIGNTLSRNQQEYANAQIERLGLQERIRVTYQDYRDLKGTFDKLVSIGMFEHVGRKHVRGFFRVISALVKEGGLGLLHTIGKDKASPGDPWTLRYIFPGGYIPNLGEIVRQMGKAGLSILDVENLRMHYARTLDLWAANYERNSARIREMFDEAFFRRWRLFLNSSSAGFKFGRTRLFQVLFSNGLNNNLPMTRSHLYI